MDFELTTCTLRPWCQADVESLAHHANNRKLWINLRDRFPHPYTREEAENWIEYASQQFPTTDFAVVVNGAAVGGIGLILGHDIDRRSAEIGYWLGEKFWGQGIITEAIQAMLAYGFSQFDLCRIWASVLAWNPASMRVLEKTGFIREGILRKAATKDGKTIDTILYALTIE